jgi:Tfp pilus assembly protein PilX
MRLKAAFSQQGMALPIALILMVCITFLALGFAALYSGRLTLNTSYVNKYDAQFVAETGLDHYLWILNNDPYGVDTFITSLHDPINNTYTYSGYNQEANGYYNIACAPPTPNPNLLNLTCTGWLASDPGQQFSFTTTVQTRTFTQYLYVTQKETEDDGTAQVYWMAGDNLHGKLFTNDIIHTRDNSALGLPNTTPIFWDTVSCWDNGRSSSEYSSDIAADVANSNGSEPTWMANEFQKGVSAPHYFPPKQAAGEYTLPSANSIANLKTIAQSQGLYFDGRTCICLDHNKIDVENAQNGTTTFVWNNGNGPGNELTLPENAVIYVDGNSSGKIDESIGGSYDPSAKFTKLDDGNAFVSGTLSGQLTIYASNNIYLTAGDPTNWSLTGNQPPSSPSTINSNSILVNYQNTSFHGSSDQSEGIASSVSGTNDMLGLIAYNYVMILRYGWPYDQSPYYVGTAGNNNTGNYDYSPLSSAAGANNVVLDAAVMAINYSFLYECNWAPYLSSTYASNPYPILNVTGSIIQSFRGAVAGDYNVNLGCGYEKNYWYDNRMQYETPPYFLPPGNSGWGILSWSSIPPSNITFTQAQNITVPQDGSSVSQGKGLQLSATVAPNSAPATVTWSFSPYPTETITDPATGSSIDPYTGFLMAGTKGTPPLEVKVYAWDNIYPTVAGTATITINP